MVIVLFEVTLKEGKMADYLGCAEQLKEWLAHEEGFLSAERFSRRAAEGKLLSLSMWKDEESVARWRNNLNHRMCQKIGRMQDFKDYKITVASPLRTYTMQDRGEAPEDANTYFTG